MQTITMDDLVAAFPFDEARARQLEALSYIARNKFNALCEIPTGEGKTAIGMAVLRALSKAGIGPIFYIAPSKTLVEQIRRQFPDDVTVVLGRSEYDCLYYTDRGENIDAATSPCYMLKCGHRLNMETGETVQEGATPCPYFQAKFEAAQKAQGGGIILTTTAFFLMNRFSVPQWRDMEPALVVVDECHDLAKITRGLFEYRMTYDHLWKVGDLLMQFAPDQAERIYEVARALFRIAKRQRAETPTLLKDADINLIIEAFEQVDIDNIENDLREAVELGDLDPVNNRQDIKIIEGVVRGLPKFLRSLKYALADEEYVTPGGTKGRHALNYVVAFRYDEETLDEAGALKSLAWIGIKSYFVAGLLKKALGKRVVGYSATIGDPDIFAHESGLRLPFKAFGSSFDPKRTRIYLPTDTPHLSTRQARADDKKKAMKQLTKAAKRFAEAGQRSLVIVISEEERAQVLKRLKDAGLEVMTYGEGLKAKQAANRFKDGEGQVLLGTASQYAQGVDLPDQIAPVIFFLRPGYQRPDDPMTQFEERRFPQSHCWRLWQYRVMLEALQVRGRNVRSLQDLGVCFFISQQFRNIVYRSLPEVLRTSYNEKLTIEAGVDEALVLLAG